MKYTPPIGGAADDPYVDGNPGTGTEGSAVPAAAIEDTQREIIEVIEQAGLVPSEADLTQLHQAIAILIASNVAPDATQAVKGIMELANHVEALGGVDDQRALTSAGLFSAASLGANGYYTFPGGLIVQWGRYNGGSFGPTITFPITFPNALYAITGLIDDTSISQAALMQIINPSTANFVGSQYRINTSNTSTHPFYWVALGT